MYDMTLNTKKHIRNGDDYIRKYIVMYCLIFIKYEIWRSLTFRTDLPKHYEIKKELIRSMKDLRIIDLSTKIS